MPKIFSGKLLLTVGFIMFLHVFILGKYITHLVEHKNQQPLNNIIRSFSELLSLVDQSNSSSDLNHVIRSFNGIVFNYNPYQLKLIFTPRPQFPLQFQADNLQAITAKIFTGNKPPDLSIQLFNKSWLNFQIITTHNLYGWANDLLVLELLMVIVAALYGWSIVRFKLPLATMKNSAERLGRDLHSMPIEELGGPELVKETTKAMNAMQNRIQELLQNRVLLLATISHDLRTPITRLKLRAQFVDELQATNILQDLDEMESMITSILAFAQEDKDHEKKILVDICALLSAICEDFIDQGYALHSKIPDEHIPFLGLPLALKRAITNIINNAFKYATMAWVEFENLAEQMIITIQDDGPGIAENEVDQIFDPYFRSQTVQAKGITGSGLGLAIAQEIFKAHNASITIANNANGGLLVTICLPKKI